MEFGLAFSYVFNDPDWVKKILLVALISLIPIVGQLVLFGFVVEIMRRVIQNDPLPLPDLDFGGFLGKGFQYFVITFVYSLPMFLFTAPTYVLNIIQGSGNSSDVLTYVSYGVYCICGGLALLYGILMIFLVPAALGRFASEGSLGAAFKIGEVFGLVKASPVSFLIAALVAALGSLIGSLGTILCVIGVVATMTYSNAITAHIYAQAYKQASEKLAA